MKKPLYIITALVLILTVSFSACAGTIEDLVAAALKNNPTVRSAEAREKKAEEEKKAAFRRLWPTLSLDSSYKYVSKVNTVTIEMPMGMGSKELEFGDHDTYDNGITLSWLLFNGFAKESAVYISEVKRSAMTLQTEKTKKEIAFRTVSTYLTARSLKLQQEIVQKGRDRAQLQYEKTDAWVKNDITLPIELMTISLTLSRYDQQLLSIDSSLHNAEQQLQDLTGLTPDVPTDAFILAEDTPAALNITRNEDIQALLLQHDITSASRTIAGAKDYPDISAYTSARRGKPGVNPVDNEWMDYSVAGIFAQWNVWDWGARWADTAAQDNEQQNIVTQRQTLEDQLRLKYDTAVRDHETMKKQLQVLKEAASIARDRMKIIEQQAENGIVSATDFRDADADLNQAELAVMQQELLIAQKLIEIDMISGRPIKEWRISHD